jgi:hypothetical protein
MRQKVNIPPYWHLTKIRGPRSSEIEDINGSRTLDPGQVWLEITPPPLTLPIVHVNLTFVEADIYLQFKGMARLSGATDNSVPVSGSIMNGTLLELYKVEADEVFS